MPDQAPVSYAPIDPAPSPLRTSASVALLADALAKAQSQFGDITKDREVQVKSEKGAYKFAYATMSEIREQTRGPLADNGLAIVQAPTVYDRSTYLVTRLLHSSGEWIESVLPVRVEGNMQALGSALTYLRRYAYSSLLCISADDDDDGSQASGNQVTNVKDRPRTSREQPPRGQVREPVTYYRLRTIEGVSEFRTPDELRQAWRKRILGFRETGAIAGLSKAYTANTPIIEEIEQHDPQTANWIRDAVNHALNEMRDNADAGSTKNNGQVPGRNGKKGDQVKEADPHLTDAEWTAQLIEQIDTAPAVLAMTAWRADPATYARFTGVDNRDRELASRIRAAETRAKDRFAQVYQGDRG